MEGRSVAFLAGRFHFHNPIVCTSFVSAHRFVRRRSECCPCAQAEACAVAWTNDYVTFDGAASEFTTVVGAYIVDGVDLPADVEHGDQLRVDFDLRIVTGR